jgi:hypothetical protein
MERPTKTLKTPGGHTVVIKEYLTAREVDGILRELFKDRESTDAKVSVPMVLGIDRNTALVKCALISFDDIKENPFDALQDLPASEYAFVLKEVQELANGNF